MESHFGEVCLWDQPHCSISAIAFMLRAFSKKPHCCCVVAFVMNKRKIMRGSAIILDDVLKEKDEEDLFDDIMKLLEHANEDSTMIFGWKVKKLVRAIHVAQA